MKQKKLSIIIPVYNEINTILQVLKKIEKTKLRYVKKEIIIVDDFSIDGSRKIIKNIKKYKTVFHNKNYGKGMAVKTGLSFANGDIIIIQDSDLEYDPINYDKLINPILKNNADVVYGSRFITMRFNLFGKNKTIIPLHYFGNLFLTLLTNILYKTNITDMETGYKVFKKDVIKRIKLNAKGFEFEPEITAKILKKGYKIHEVPIDFNPRDYGQGKKITWRDGIKAAYYLLIYRFN